MKLAGFNYLTHIEQRALRDNYSSAQFAEPKKINQVLKINRCRDKEDSRYEYYKPSDKRAKSSRPFSKRMGKRNQEKHPAMHIIDSCAASTDECTLHSTLFSQTEVMMTEQTNKVDKLRENTNISANPFRPILISKKGI